MLSEDNPDLIISPAKYTFDDEKINISGIGPQNPSELPDYMKEYVQKYLTEFESIGNTILFQKLILKKIATAFDSAKIAHFSLIIFHISLNDSNKD